MKKLVMALVEAVGDQMDRKLMAELETELSQAARRVLNECSLNVEDGTQFRRDLELLADYAILTDLQQRHAVALTVRREALSDAARFIREHSAHGIENIAQGVENLK